MILIVVLLLLKLGIILSEIFFDSKFQNSSVIVERDFVRMSENGIVHHKTKIIKKQKQTAFLLVVGVIPVNLSPRCAEKTH